MASHAFILDEISYAKNFNGPSSETISTLEIETDCTCKFVNITEIFNVNIQLTIFITGKLSQPDQVFPLFLVKFSVSA